MRNPTITQIIMKSLESEEQYLNFWWALPFSHGGSTMMRLKPQSFSAAKKQKSIKYNRRTASISALIST